MPVNRAYISPYATTDSNLYQALTQLANFSDSLEQAAGVQVGSQSTPTSAPVPATASWTITAAGDGHFRIAIANPSVQAPVQHQIQSSTNNTFTTALNTYTLGFGQSTLDIVDPHVTKYFRLRSAFPGSIWNSWLVYSTAAGVAALASGALVV